jgi:hypothetical protein
MYTEQLTYLQIKNELDQWCDEYGIYASDDMHYPWEPDCCLSIMQCLWRMHSEGRVNTMRGIRGYFDRYVAFKHLEKIAVW